MWCEPHNTLLQIRLLTHVDWVVIHMRLQPYLHGIVGLSTCFSFWQKK